MAKVKIITDSVSDIPHEIAESLNIEIVPVRVVVDGQSLRDRIELDLDTFYKRLEYDSFVEQPYTESVNEDDYRSALEKNMRENDGVVSIHVSKELSKTFEMAKTVEVEMEGLFKKRAAIIDSQLCSMAFGMLVIEAAKAAKAGSNVQQIQQYIERIRHRMKMFFVVPSLKYLRQGGKISGWKSLIGSVIGAKPILTMKDGKIIPYSRAFGDESHLLPKIIREATQDVGSKKINVAIVHCAVPNLAEEVRKIFKESFNCDNIYVCPVGPSIGVNTGPGTIGFFYYEI